MASNAERSAAKERATKMKDEGNTHYGAGNFFAAEGLYSKAIIADATNPSLYTNRAMSRIKLALYESAASDCHACLKLNGPNMKAYFILSQCLVALHDFDGALENALEAHKMGTETNDKSLPHLTTQVLRCKKERWDELEKKQSREGQELENELIRLLEREHNANIVDCISDIERKEVVEEFDNKITLLKATFEAARSASEKKRQVPDWVIDDISFGIMIDPVITKTGKSYERASILEALRRNPIDPITREPLHPSDLRPNIGLREACDEFLKNNGWAVDW
ncbi:U-box domain-containing protein [Xylaria longipes]|nr:U-box domain-containing protein [Xylaria longipes]